MLYRLEKRPSWALFLTAECSMESGWRMPGVHKLFAKGGIHFLFSVNPLVSPSVEVRVEAPFDPILI